MPDTMESLFNEALSVWAEQFDGGPETDLSISGADFLDWFCQWRVRAKSVQAQST